MTDVVVVSTGMNCDSRSRCIDSVKRQRFVSVQHLIVDAEKDEPPRTKIENLRASIARLPAEQVVCVVDLDDWLEPDYALVKVVEAHREGAWATYGSFRYADGRRGWAAQVYDPRGGPWSATHLKSFRAGLFQAVKDEDLRGPTECGGWIDRADDLAYMIPILEMAGDRTKFISEMLYVYDFAQSFEFNAKPEARQHELNCAAWVRSRPRYERLTTLERGASFDEALP